MEYANYPKYLRAFSIALLGLLLIGVGLTNTAHAAASCSAKIQKAQNGAYEGCVVKMGNREFTVGANRSSEEGCSQVCSIMAEVNQAGSKKTAKIGTSTFRR
jgi:hypothetical protein